MDIVGSNHSILSFLASSTATMANSHTSGMTALTNGLLIPMESALNSQQYCTGGGGGGGGGDSVAYSQSQTYHNLNQHSNRILHSRNSLCACFTVRQNSQQIFFIIFVSRSFPLYLHKPHEF